MVFSNHLGDNYGWFRVFGYGIAWKYIPDHGLTFSERHGYTKILKIGKWGITLIKK